MEPITEKQVLEKIRDINAVVREGNIYDKNTMDNLPFQKLVQFLAISLQSNAYLISEIGIFCFL